MVFGRGKKAKKDQAVETGESLETADSAAGETTGGKSAGREATGPFDV